LGHSPLPPWRSSRGGGPQLITYFHFLAPCFLCYILFPYLLQTTILPFLLTTFFLCILGYIMFLCLLQTSILSFSTTPFSLHLTNYNLKLGQPHANIIKLELQQVFKKKTSATPPKSGYNVVLVQYPSLSLLSPY
jgi:hypothetical protein